MVSSPARGMVLRVVGADDWPVWRELRLASLTDAPEAFWSTLADWSGPNDTEARWRERLSTTPFNLVAEVDGVAVGMVSAGEPWEGGADSEVELASMWVAPGGRGQGVGDALIEAVVDWAREQGFGRLVLWVRQGNARAVSLYERSGFVDDGVEPDPGDSFPARRMSRSVR